jgi:hypothetical protein
MIRVIGLLTIIILSSCTSTQLSRPTYSDSVGSVIQLVRNEINDEDFKTLNVIIINSHNGRYYLNTTISKESDTLLISTKTDKYGMKSDTLMTFGVKSFIDMLDHETKQTQLILAGNYQDITIEYKDKKDTFYARNAFGLMSLLRQGKND